jgi:hypothetical protein
VFPLVPENLENNTWKFPGILKSGNVLEKILLDKKVHLKACE